VSLRRWRTRRDDRRWTFAEEVVSAVTEAELGRLASLAHDADVLEIGAYYGRSTIALASVAKVVHSIDPHRGGPDDDPDTLPAFLENLGSHGVRERVVVHVGLSTDVVPLVKPDSFDVVFVDAMHQRPAVDVDLALAAGCVRAGGWLAMHDYGLDGVYVGETWHPFGVTEAVDEFVALTGAGAPSVVDRLAVVAVPDSPEKLGAWQAGLERFAPAA
jgi:predicted O-methyltransferase YrrM